MCHALKGKKAHYKLKIYFEYNLSKVYNSIECKGHNTDTGTINMYSNNEELPYFEIIKHVFGSVTPIA